MPVPRGNDEITAADVLGSRRMFSDVAVTYRVSNGWDAGAEVDEDGVDGWVRDWIGAVVDPGAGRSGPFANCEMPKTINPITIHPPKDCLRFAMPPPGCTLASPMGGVEWIAGDSMLGRAHSTHSARAYCSVKNFGSLSTDQKQHLSQYLIVAFCQKLQY